MAARWQDSIDRVRVEADTKTWKLLHRSSTPNITRTSFERELARRSGLNIVRHAADDLNSIQEQVPPRGGEVVLRMIYDTKLGFGGDTIAATLTTGDGQPVASGQFLFGSRLQLGLGRGSPLRHVATAAAEIAAFLVDEIGRSSPADRVTAAIEWALQWNATTVQALRDENSALRRLVDEANERENGLRIEVERLEEIIRRSSESLEAAKRKPSLRRDVGLVVLGAGLAFAGAVSADAIAEHRQRSDPPAADFVTGDIDAGTIVFGDVTYNLCSTAALLNPGLATAVSSLQVIELPEVD